MGISQGHLVMSKWQVTKIGDLQLCPGNPPGFRNGQIREKIAAGPLGHSLSD